MAFSHVIILTLSGLSASLLYYVPIARRLRGKQVTIEKLKIIGEALEQAEERAVRFQERHDRILGQVCAYYLTHKELEEALAGARVAMNEAVEIAANLRKMQIKLINSFPDDYNCGVYMVDTSF